MHECESCGMPLAPEVAAVGDYAEKFCKYCTDAEGNLKTRQEVRDSMIQFYKSRGKSQQEAEEYVDAYMSAKPVWQND